MEFDFSFQNPTRIHFGRSALEHLEKELEAFGPRVLLVYGQGSIKRSGLYDALLTRLRKAGKQLCELGGISSNPTLVQVEQGIALARRFQPDLILAVGGGSVLDCAKAIAAGALFEGDFWEAFFVKRAHPTAALPLGCILTLAGTGSECNGNAVITNEETKKKGGMYSKHCYPVFSLIDPTLCYTLSQWDTASGVCDIASHLLETYCSPSDADTLSDDLCEAVLRRLFAAASLVLRTPDDYEARACISWAATLALFGILDASKTGDWMAHQIQHQIGAYTSCPHGLCLAAIAGPYYRAVLPHAPARFARLAQKVFLLTPLPEESDEALGARGIDALVEFFSFLGAPPSLRGLGVPADLPWEKLVSSIRRLPGGYRAWSDAALLALLKEAY